MDDMASRLASLEGVAPRVKEEIKTLQSGLAVAEAVCPELWVSPDFDRPPIPGLLQVRVLPAETMASIASLRSNKSCTTTVLVGSLASSES